MLWKEHVAEEPHLQQVQPIVMEMTVNWWRTPDPHFLYLCLTVPPVPHSVWAARLSVT